MSIAVHADWSGTRSSPSPSDEFVLLSEPDLGRRRAVTQVEHVHVMVDARLDNERELKADLHVASTALVAEVFGRAYLRWGDSFARHLIGDFAGVLWDSKRRRLTAVRDPFGVRPLFYRRASSAIWMGTDERQVLGTFQGLPPVDDYAVLEHLLAIYSSTERTFFRDVRRLPPGHVLTVDEQQLRIERTWDPPQTRIDRTRAEPTREHLDEFRRLFKRAVASRLETASAAVVHVSGGVDSSSVAVACDELRREGRPFPPVVGASATYPGLACDESFYVDSVARRVGFPIERWDGTASVVLSDLVEPATDFPAAQSAFTDGTHGDLVIAKRFGAQIILTGDGGDELTVSSGTVRDMLDRREWRRAANRLFFYRGPDSTSALRRLKALAVQYLPEPVEAWRVRSHTPLPGWLRPELNPLVCDITRPTRRSGEGSHAASSVWTKLNSPQLIRSIELHHRQALPAGVEYRYPFLDSELVRFVVSISNGYWPMAIRPHQRALADLLPPEVAGRHSKADLTPAFANRIRAAGGAIERQFRDPLWASQKYVSREKALSAWRDFDGGGGKTDGHHYRQLWAMVTLEAWLRKVLGYSFDLQKGGSGLCLTPAGINPGHTAT